MVGVLIIFPAYPWFLEGKEEKRKAETLEGELGCLPLPFSLMFEILFMSYRVLRLGGIEYTVEGV